MAQGKGASNKKPQLITLGSAEALNANNAAQGAMQSSMVLAGFPSSSIVVGYQLEAILGVQEYKNAHDRYAIEKGMPIESLIDFGVDYSEYTCTSWKKRIEKEIGVYESVVPSKELFERFKERALLDFEARIEKKEKLTQTEKKAYALLKSGRVGSFYYFAREMGIIDANPLMTVDHKWKDKDFSALIQKLIQTKLEASLALHYYMEGMETGDTFPKLKIDGYSSGKYYSEILSSIEKNPEKKEEELRVHYLETIDRQRMSSLGEKAAFEHIQSVLMRTHRWVDVTNHEAEIYQQISGDADYVSALKLGVLPVSIPEELYKSDAFSSKIKGLSKRLKSSELDFSGLPVGLDEDLISYYDHCERLKLSARMFSDYQASMGKKGVSGIIPSYMDNSSVSSVDVISDSQKSEMDTVVHSVDSASVVSEGRAAVNAQTHAALDTFYQTGRIGVSYASRFVGKAVVQKAAQNVAVRSVGKVAGVVFGSSLPVALLIGLSVTVIVDYACDLYNEYKQGVAEDYLKEIIKEYKSNINFVKKSLERMNKDPRMLHAKKYVLDILSKKANLTTEEELLLAYLQNGEVSLEVTYDDKFINKVPNELKSATTNLAKTAGSYLSLQTEAEFLSLCMGMYEANQVSINGDRSCYTASINERIYSHQKDVLTEHEIANDGEENMPAWGVPPKTLEVKSNIDILNFIPKTQPSSHKIEVMRSLTCFWEGDKSIGDELLPDIPAAYQGARRDVVSAYVMRDGGGHALFGHQSFWARRTRTLAEKEKYTQLKEKMGQLKEKMGVSDEEFSRAKELKGKKSLSQGEKKEYSALARKITTGFKKLSEDEQKEYKSLNEKLKQYEVLGEKQYKVLVEKDEEGSLVVTDYLSYYKKMGIIPADSKVNAENYNFAQAVYYYAHDENALLRSWTMTNKITSLFPSRSERYNTAKSHNAPDSLLEEKFDAEREVCEDIIRILGTSPDAKAVCEQMGLRYDSKQKKIIFDTDELNSQGTTRSLEGVMYQADLVEKRCCALLREFERYRQNRLSSSLQKSMSENTPEKTPEKTSVDIRSMVAWSKSGEEDEPSQSLQQDIKLGDVLQQHIKSGDVDKLKGFYDSLGPEKKFSDEELCQALELTLNEKKPELLDVIVTKEMEKNPERFINLRKSLKDSSDKKYLQNLQKALTLVVKETSGRGSGKKKYDSFLKALKTEGELLSVFFRGMGESDIKEVYDYTQKNGSLSLRNKKGKSQKKNQTDLFFKALKDAVAAKKKKDEGALKTALGEVNKYYENANIVAEEEGLSSFNLAIQTGDLKLIELLLRHEKATGDVLTKKYQGKTPFEVAVETDNPQIIKLLLTVFREKDIRMEDHEASRKALLLARSGDKTGVLSLIKRGTINIKDTKDDNGRTQLHWLAQHNHLTELTYIVKNRFSGIFVSDFLAEDKNGHSPLDLIDKKRVKDKEEFVLFLLDAELEEMKNGGDFHSEVLKELYSHCSDKGKKTFFNKIEQLEKADEIMATLSGGDGVVLNQEEKNSNLLASLNLNSSHMGSAQTDNTVNGIIQSRTREV